MYGNKQGGGGCAAFATKKLMAFHEDRRQKAEAKEEAKHAAWLLTPEGQESIRLEEERVIRDAEYRRQEAARKIKLEAWLAGWNRLKSTPPAPGTVFEGEVELEFAPAKTGYDFAVFTKIGIPKISHHFADLRWYPRSRGLLVFMDKSTTNTLAKLYPEHVIAATAGETRFELVLTKRLKLLRYANNGKAAIGTLV